MSERLYIPNELQLTDMEKEAVEQAVELANLEPSFFYEFGDDCFHWSERNNSQGVYEGPGYNPSNEDQLTVIGLPPFANNFPHNRLRDAVVATALDFSRRLEGKGTAAVVQVANNTRQNRVYDYSSEDIEALQNGSFTPFTDRILRALDERKLKGGQVLLSGQSQGGSVALAVADRLRKYYDLQGVAATEPTTFIDQTPKQQQKAFMKGGLEDMNAAVMESGVYAVADMLKIKDSPKQTIPQLLNTISFAWGAMTEDNTALKRAMASDRGFEDIRDLNDAGVKVVIMSGAASLILPEAVMLELKQEFVHRDDTVEIVVGYDSKFLRSKDGASKPHGHGIGDNIAAVAGLALRVVR